MRKATIPSDVIPTPILPILTTVSNHDGSFNSVTLAIPIRETIADRDHAPSVMLEDAGFLPAFESFRAALERTHPRYRKSHVAMFGDLDGVV